MDPGLRRDDEDEGGGLVFVGTIVATEVAPTRTRRPCGSWWERRSSRPRQGCEGTFDESHPLLSSSRRRPGSSGDVIGYCESQRAFALSRKPETGATRSFRDDEDEGGGLVLSERLLRLKSLLQGFGGLADQGGSGVRCDRGRVAKGHSTNRTLSPRHPGAGRDPVASIYGFRDRA